MAKTKMLWIALVLSLLANAVLWEERSRNAALAQVTCKARILAKHSPAACGCRGADWQGA